MIGSDRRRVPTMRSRTLKPRILVIVVAFVLAMPLSPPVTSNRPFTRFTR